MEKKKKIAKLVRSKLGPLKIFELLENWVVKYSKKTNIIPIFIIGSPRTGSTLLVKLLSSYYQFGYIPNISSMFYKSPILITKLLSPIMPKNIDFMNIKTKFGVIDNFFAPSEAAKVNENWFDDKSFTKINSDFIKKSIHTLTNIFSGPFLCKNLNNSLRLQNILQVFPNALFIYIKRDRRYVVQSLILEKKELFGNYKEWLGPKPNNYKELLTNKPIERVYFQVKAIEDFIEHNISTGNVKNLIKIEYNNLCLNPESVINSIVEWYKRRKIFIKRKDMQKIKQFNPSLKIRLPEEMWKEIEIIHKEYS